MNDPHVERLTYAFRHGTDVTYRVAAPLQLSRPEFGGRLDGDTLTIEMVKHFASVEEARAIVDPYLRAWEVHEQLVGMREEISFAFRDADLVDRNPASTKTLFAAVTDRVVVSATQSAHTIRPSYPGLPGAFTVTPDVESLLARFTGYRKGREPLPAMAFFCLSTLESAFGGRPALGIALNVEKSVLSKLGELSSERGDAANARKAPKRGALHRALSGSEAMWLEAVTARLIARLAEVAAGKAVTPLTFAQLPALL